MSEPPTGRHPRSGDRHAARGTHSTGAAAGGPEKRSLLQRLVEFVSPGPDSRDELIETLADAEERELIEPESRAMLEGVIRMASMSAGDVMVAAPRMDLLNIDAPYDELLHLVIETGHSRFPVYEGHRDNILGILMSKDLLKLQRAPELNLRTLLRPAVFVPESKSLNDLLRDFRSNRNHLAIVIDEFGSTAGLITIEDVLEEIVGEIEDEFDDKDGDSGVYTLADGSQRVAGDTTIATVNEAFGIALPEDDFDTIGGLIAHEHGQVPRRGETVQVAGLAWRVLLTRGGAVRWFRVSRADGEDPDAAARAAAAAAPPPIA
jgi:magnesium and cobalt transporter